MASIGQAQSLAMLVQQRELQNSKKLEALVLKNDELAEAWQHAEKEREALLERLCYLDNRITETCSGLLGVRKDSDGMMAEYNSRVSYLEQGVEERFRLLEQQVRETAPTDSITTQRLMTELSSRDKTISKLQNMITTLAQKVGGIPLRQEIESTTEAAKAAIDNKVKDLYSGLEVLDMEGKDVSCRVDELEAQLVKHERALTEKFDNFEKRLQSNSNVVATVSSIEGRLNSAEGTLAVLSEQQTDLTSTNQAAMLRLEKIEQNTGTLMGRMSSTEASSKTLDIRIEDIGTRITQCEDNVKTITNDIAVMDEKRRQKEAQEQSTASKLLELDRQDISDIKKDIEILKDRGPLPHPGGSTADESRLLSLVNELDRGKEVLESIVKMHEVRFSDMSEDLEKRIQKIEQATIREHTSYAYTAEVSPRSIVSETTKGIQQQTCVGQSKSVSPKRSGSGHGVETTSEHSVTAHVPDMTATSQRERETVIAKTELPQSDIPSIRNTMTSSSPMPVLSKQEFEQSVQRQEEWRKSYLTSASPAPPPLPEQHHLSEMHPPSASVRGSVLPSPVNLLREEPLHNRHDPMSVAMEIKAQLEDRLAASRDVMDERRRLESDLEKTNQQLSFIQMAFQTLAEKEGTLDGSKHVFNGWVKQLESDNTEKASAVKGKLLKMMEDIRKSKHNVYEREWALVEEGSKLRKMIAELRETEKSISDEMHRLQKMLAASVPGVSLSHSSKASLSPGRGMPPAYRPKPETSPMRLRDISRSRSRSPNFAY
eukprot:TRINITY_DN24350_c0_g1_i1.p1 TRINITY_DN24350_c0_g1~~TRINITY_DN24350_c0_g1_i1.p1  ORF type:complete len:770 (+),score=194.90 TRINITY_DN24350_c0_g1_i1:145-2454(+)